MTLPEHTNPPGKSNATASLVLGIIAVVFWFFGYSSILSVILGIVGLIQASKAKELGYLDAIRTAGFVLSLIGLIGGALEFLRGDAARGMWGVFSTSQLLALVTLAAVLPLLIRHLRTYGKQPRL